MYLMYYQLNQEPFQVTPDPDFLFPSRTHREALAAIVYGVEQRKGFIAITGDVGLGKTTVLRSYLSGPHGKDVRVVYIYDPELSFDELLTVIYQELGLPPRSESTSAALRGLYKALIDSYRAHEPVVLVVDEAQNMPVSTLESLRMLSNLETAADKLIQIVLCGQPEFEEILREQRLRQLQQRIAVWARLEPLTRKESAAYLRHRLEKAAFGSTPIMTNQTIALIANAARGIPRNLNIIADNVLITGFGYDKRPVTPEIAREVISDQMRNRQLNRRPRRALVAGGAVAAVLMAIVAGSTLYDPEGRAGIAALVQKKAAIAGGEVGQLAENVLGWVDTTFKLNLSALAVPAESTARRGMQQDGAATEPAAQPASAVRRPAHTGSEASAPHPLVGERPSDAATETSGSPMWSETGRTGPDTHGIDNSRDRRDAVPSPKPDGGTPAPTQTVTAPAATPAPAASVPPVAAAAGPTTAEAASSATDRSRGVVGPSEPAPSEQARAEDWSAPAPNEDSGTVWTVRRGDTASKIIIEFYGNFSPRLLRLVEEANPQIADLNILDRGDQLTLPSIGDRRLDRIAPADDDHRPRRASRSIVDHDPDRIASDTGYREPGRITLR